MFYRFIKFKLIVLPTHQAIWVYICEMPYSFLNSETEILNLMEFDRLFRIKGPWKWLEFIPKVEDLSGGMKSATPLLRLATGSQKPRFSDSSECGCSLCTEVSSLLLSSPAVLSLWKKTQIEKKILHGNSLFLKKDCANLGF